jgi:hypothetical protein
LNLPTKPNTGAREIMKFILRTLLITVIVLLTVIPYGHGENNLPVLLYSVSGHAQFPKGTLADPTPIPKNEYAIVDINQLKSLKPSDKVLVNIGNVNTIMDTKSIQKRSDGITWLGIPENYSSWDYLL